MSRTQIAEYLLTHVGGDESQPWQAGHNYAMREAARLVQEKWDELGAVVAAGPVEGIMVPGSEWAAVVAERDALRAALGVVAGDASDDAVLLAFTRENARADRAEATLAKLAAIHVKAPMFESCDSEVTGCERDDCTENPHDGMWLHTSEPCGFTCGECCDDEGQPVEWPCPTTVILDANPAPKTERHPDVDYRALSENAPRRDVPQADSKPGQNLEVEADLCGLEACDMAGFCQARIPCEYVTLGKPEAPETPRKAAAPTEATQTGGEVR